MSAIDCRISEEKSLFALCALISGLAWVALIISVIGLVYGLFLGLFFLMAQALFISHVRGHAVKLSATQLPALYARLVNACEALGLSTIPDAYVMQGGGLLNAFATKFIGRNYVIIYSDLIEACDEDGQAIDMIIAHEVGHLAHYRDPVGDRDSPIQAISGAGASRETRRSPQTVRADSATRQSAGGRLSAGQRQLSLFQCRAGVSGGRQLRCANGVGIRSQL